MDPYVALKIGRNCTKSDIKKAFFKLAHIHHPDKGGDEKEFKRINSAYQFLMKNHIDGGNLNQGYDRSYGRSHTTTTVYKNGVMYTTTIIF